jgi:mannose/fructose/N-acetylgalactosamine-specific phosphotransferase system component IIB
MVKKMAIALIGLSALLLSACAPAATPAPGSKSYGLAPAQPPVMEAPAAPAPSEGSRAIENANSYGQASQTEADSAQRLVIKNASLNIVVADPVQAMDKIAKLAEDLGGYVVTSNIYKTRLDSGAEVPAATITIRVKAESLNDALGQIKALVKDPKQDILSETVSGQDVTKEYTDLQSRLTNLQQAESQLREIMASATKPEDVLNIFNQLTQVREQIEVLKGQIKYYEESAALSAISVQLTAQAAVEPLTIAGWQPVGVARNAVQTLINTLQILVNAVIWLVLYVVPVLAVIGLPIAVIVLLIRRWISRRRARAAAPPPAAAV